MININIKQEKTEYLNLKDTISQELFLNYFKKGIKPKNNLKIGMEYERLSVDKKTFKAKSYYYENGIAQFLTSFCEKYSYTPVYTNNFIIGAKKNGVIISLEPGAQLEISTNSYHSINEIKQELDKIEKQTNELAEEFNIKFLAYGITPVSNIRQIQLIPKTRYHIMSQKLTGDEAPVMMRQTAGIQATLDFYSEEDAIKKLRIALMLSPFATALFANSPFVNNKFTQYQSNRAKAWLNTDNSRCGLISYKLFNKEQYQDFTFKDYLDILLNTPLLFLNRNNKSIKINKPLTFKQFMQTGYKGYHATLEDFELHASLYFPDVRLKNYIEIRNHDCISGNLKYAVPSLYKGLLYSDNSHSQIETLFKNLTYIDFVYLRNTVPLKGIHTELYNHKVYDYLKELLTIAYNSLKAQNDNDCYFLIPFISLINQKTSLADRLIMNKKLLLTY